MSPPASHRRRSRRLSWPLLFVTILAVHSLAVYLFTRGFLLTRTELDLHSSRDDRPPQGDVSAGCSSWPPPAVDRLVIVVLDALRWAILDSSSSTSLVRNSEQRYCDAVRLLSKLNAIYSAEKHPWMDKLQVLQKLAANEKTSARIFKALADPPTTSLQRLKALTTGGLPTFIDVGNSFGAPAIVEDNIMHQVDNGVIEHLLPSLQKNDWDVLIAHFLGVDHAGHIFGVESTPMIQKLEQYNQILEGVIDTLRSISKPGGTHENTLLLVMGDHGQTLNGDHGGGTAEEVETSLFAWSPNTPPDAVLSVLDDSSCNADLVYYQCHLHLNSNHLTGKRCASALCSRSVSICTLPCECSVLFGVCLFSSWLQLDFAATISALLGIPFPFGRCVSCFFNSIGRVNPELYALSTGTWFNQKMGTDACTSQNDLEAWMSRYAEVLCVNCWQVKRYIDQYSATSVIGFPSEDLQHITNLYSRAQANSSASFRTTCSSETGSQDKLEGKGSVLPQQIDAYTDFLQTFAKLARSAWTEFDLWSMGIGLLLMILSVIIQACALVKLNTICQPSDQKSHSSIIPKFSFAFALVVIRAASFLSNSYICVHLTGYDMVQLSLGKFDCVPSLLLSIDTFGVSHILPILSLPFISMVWYNTTSKDNKLKDVILNNITQVLLMYGLITAIPATLTIICVTIQRRHLMVWGLFAPKYVFDAIGLLLTDLLICLASLYYS
ncbi:hypothetical protein HU200_021077 [Digitaria exilis]|uniref:GPI ethanolamine phosphate transferase 3 n=1 Tax=Digitaria exilis TaxID=1010633 RepID=A0A835EZS3_9POAL|nr:hypothetical protein HU200_021077 [Digitaria exilis]